MSPQPRNKKLLDFSVFTFGFLTFNVLSTGPERTCSQNPAITLHDFCTEGLESTALPRPAWLCPRPLQFVFQRIWCTVNTPALSKLNMQLALHALCLAIASKHVFSWRQVLETRDVIGRRTTKCHQSSIDKNLLIECVQG